METPHRVRVEGEMFARGVACTLITAGQAFECRPVEGEAQVFEITVDRAGVRFLPAGCRRDEARSPGP